MGRVGFINEDNDLENVSHISGATEASDKHDGTISVRNPLKCDGSHAHTKPTGKTSC